MLMIEEEGQTDVSDHSTNSSLPPDPPRPHLNPPPCDCLQPRRGRLLYGWRGKTHQASQKTGRLQAGGTE